MMLTAQLAIGLLLLDSAENRCGPERWARAFMALLIIVFGTIDALASFAEKLP